MRITDRYRSAQVRVTLNLEDAPLVTLGDGTQVQPQTMTIDYSGRRDGGADWEIHAYKVKANGEVGKAPKEFSAYTLETGPYPARVDNTPTWIKEIVREHAPKVPLNEV